MTSMPAPLDLDALTALEQAATPAPWAHEHEGGHIIHGPDGTVAEADYAPDAKLIAAARNVLPALLDRLAQYEGAITWGTSCLSCSKVLDGAYQETVRAEQAEAELAQMKADGGDRFVQQFVDETRLRSLEFRDGRASMDMEAAREITAAFVAAARTMLGDAPNYTETKVSLDVKVAESPELYTLVVQRHAPGALTPHEARQKAEAERDAAHEELARLRAALACPECGALPGDSCKVSPDGPNRWPHSQRPYVATAAPQADEPKPPVCPAEYTRPGGRQRGDRIVRCHLPYGHGGEHEEADTECTWLDEPAVSESFKAGVRATAAARFPHGKCSRVGVHEAHTHGGPAHFCDGSGWAAAPGADEQGGAA